MTITEINIKNTHSAQIHGDKNMNTIKGADSYYFEQTEKEPNMLTCDMLQS